MQLTARETQRVHCSLSAVPLLDYLHGAPPAVQALDECAYCQNTRCPLTPGIDIWYSTFILMTKTRWDSALLFVICLSTHVFHLNPDKATPSVEIRYPRYLPKTASSPSSMRNCPKPHVEIYRNAALLVYINGLTQYYLQIYRLHWRIYLQQLCEYRELINVPECVSPPSPRCIIIIHRNVLTCTPSPEGSWRSRARNRPCGKAAYRPTTRRLPLPHTPGTRLCLPPHKHSCPPFMHIFMVTRNTKRSAWTQTSSRDGH